jgi:hypothetical protein
VACPLERCLDRLVPPHEADRVLEIAIADLAGRERALPEGSFGLAAAPLAQDDW